MILFTIQELQDLGDMAHTFPPTPELERITYYPNYPVGPRGKERTSDIDAIELTFFITCTSILP